MKTQIKRALFVLAFLAVQIINAHIPNQSYVYLRIYEKDGIEGRYEINIREINKLLDLDLDTRSSLDELRPYIPQLQAYMLQNTSFSSAVGDHQIKFKESDMFYLGTGNYLLMKFDLTNTKELPDDMDMSYSALFDKDPTHKGFLIIEYNWKAGIINNEANILLDFGPGDLSGEFSLTEVSLWKGFWAMVKQGVWHIWIGLDHILFLLALILPAVVRRSREETETAVPLPTWMKGNAVIDWIGVPQFGNAFWYILKVVTFFTIAHTITLTLATLEWVNLNAQIVESIIAFSIGLAAFHNIRPIFKGRDWVIAFVFGLFHGFGFASVLSDLGLTGEFLSLSLLGFNIGVELGQIVIIALFFPVLFLLRQKKYYSKILVYGSITLMVISLYWVIERVFDVNLGVEDFLKSIIISILKGIGLR
ncbi:HupE/UreJ family protein [Aureicoccus marinus]|uniref:HupE / UreJ protein n=1 Tax=Aureicoccus marinus TaxID=754435 RepID=A0A2S7T6Z7_9FLAO|nr:HupE/UreJ family protein [Aureicoccus marinus]PQJ15297.1 hypothetical protein BST99_05710 [Aureicoccus marinus]